MEYHQVVLYVFGIKVYDWRWCWQTKKDTDKPADKTVKYEGDRS